MWQPSYLPAFFQPLVHLVSVLSQWFKPGVNKCQGWCLFCKQQNSSFLFDFAYYLARLSSILTLLPWLFRRVWSLWWRQELCLVELRGQWPLRTFNHCAMKQGVWWEGGKEPKSPLPVPSVHHNPPAASGRGITQVSPKCFSPASSRPKENLHLCQNHVLSYIWFPCPCNSKTSAFLNIHQQRRVK